MVLIIRAMRRGYTIGDQPALRKVVFADSGGASVDHIVLSTISGHHAGILNLMTATPRGESLFPVAYALWLLGCACSQPYDKRAAP